MIVKGSQAWCNSEHQYNHALDALGRLRKRKKAETRAKDRQTRAKLKTRSQWVSEAQAWVNKVVVLEDKPKGCISCDSPLVTDSGHYFHRGSKYRVAKLTLDRRNLTGQCRSCNSFKGGGNQHEYRLGYIARYGQQQFDDLCELKRRTDCGEIPPLTIEECKAVIAEMKARHKQLLSL